MKRLSKMKKPIYIVAAIILWMIIWECAASHLKQAIFLPYPKDVLTTLLALCKTSVFWSTVWYSLKHIAVGFALAFVVGILLAVLCSISDLLEAFFWPPLKLIKTVPVASFIILLLFYVDSSQLATVIAFLIVVPVIYTNLRKGVQEANPLQRELARVYCIPFVRRLRYIYVPSTIPYITASCLVGLSLCWKAGIAAEVIGIVRESIGRQLYEAKLYLDMAALFAWTLVIIVVSVLFEQLVMLIIRFAGTILAEPTIWFHKRELLQRCFGIQGSAKENSAEETETMENEAKLLLPQRRQMPDDKELIIKLEHINKSYGEESVLNDLTLELHRGSFVVLSGPSGCGKTTLLRILAGLTQADSGEITRKTDICVSMVFQEDRFFDGFSAFRNIKITGDGGLDQKEICEMLSGIGILEPKRKPVRAFSGGQKKRLALMQALVRMPDILLLDEPFNGIDEHRKEQMLTLIQQQHETRVTVVVTHNTSEIEKIEELIQEVNVAKWANNSAE